MRIGILSRNRRLYSTRRLLQAARQRRHDTAVIDTMTVAVEIGTDVPADRPIKTVQAAVVPRTYYLPRVDAVIPRIGTSITPYGLAVVRQFEARQVRTTATAAAIACSRDKLHSLQIMAGAALPIPRSAVIASPDALYAAVQAVGGLPVVLKSTRGTQGQQVILAREMPAAAAALADLRRLGRQVLVQQFVSEAEGRDLRVIVVGDRCVAAMERTAPEGDFRANLHRGGTAASFTLDVETSELAVAAARAHALEVAGVDLILSDRGPLLLEVNSSPGLEGIERATGIDVAGAIIRYLEASSRSVAGAGRARRRARR